MKYQSNNGVLHPDSELVAKQQSKTGTLKQRESPFKGSCPPMCLSGFEILHAKSNNELQI